jgi:predicted RNase H-like nuclease (RuvC/YqgF family)
MSTADNSFRLSQLHRKLVDGREEKVAKLEKELNDLSEEEERIKRRTAEILNIEGRTTEGTVGEYQPKFIEELTEISLHSSLFYHPKPTKA